MLHQPGPGASRRAQHFVNGPRVLIYSHDTFGLGHLRRSRAIANRLVQRHPDASIVIISGSPIIGSFEFGDGVDYVRVPGVVKHANGDYTTLSLNLPLDEAVAMREAIILQTARTLKPDLVIVDKEPTGFRGELMPALEELRNAGARVVLGVRDVMDEPSVLAPSGSARAPSMFSPTITTTSGSTASRRFTNRSPGSLCPSMCASALSIPASCAASCRRSPISCAIRALPAAPSCW